MDCASEEQMVRMKLQDDPAIKDLSFDLDQRRLVVVHANAPGDVSRKIHELNLGSALLETTHVDHWDPTSESSGQRRFTSPQVPSASWDIPPKRAEDGTTAQTAPSGRL